MGKVVMIDYARPPMSPSYKVFAAALDEKKWPLETTTIISYVSMQVLADAVKSANSLAPRAVAQTLHDKAFDTIIGKVKFDGNGDRIKPDFGIYRWTDGVLKNTGNVSYQ